ncbi:MAG: DNA replication and repair protein RecF [Paludibacter sp.]|jgi:DNA replication and repair protein RecF|nr:DNA replication and repair protein RecF [Paludibacter sp.]
MYLESLSVINYKNIRESNLAFSRKINCFLGDNGMGKTNFLDAIYYLSFCKSHSNSIDTQNILHSEEFFMLSGEYFRNDSPESVYCGLKRKQKKQFRRNKKEYERLSDHIGLLPLVMVSPDDATLIDGGSDERRKFIDGVIAQYNKTYLQYLLNYNNLLRQRNMLLKNNATTDTTVFEILEEQMDMLGQYIYGERKRFIDEFIPVFQHFYTLISGDCESVTLSYTSQYSGQSSLADKLKVTRERDRLIGFTTSGIHKDELEMVLSEHPIKRVGSQGQNKTFLVSLKFAQFEFLKKIHGFTPIVLLDDIFDKLDSKRVSNIVSLVASDMFGQIFITDTNREHLDRILSELNEEARIFKVTDGIAEQ